MPKANYSGNFLYDPSAGYICTAVRLRHTVVPKVVQRPTFWIFFVFHLAVRWAYSKHQLDESKHKDTPMYIGWHELGIISGMTTFFEVFYTNECYKRYVWLYQTTRQMLGTTYDFVLAMRLSIGRASQAHLRLSGRYVLACVMLFFFELDEEVTVGEWRQIIRLGLLYEAERDILEPLLPQDKLLTLVHWAGDVACLGHAQASEADKVPANLRKDMVDKLLRFRSQQQEVRDVLHFPVPFQYFHLLNMMIVVNLFLWAYALGCSNSNFYTIVFAFASIICMGMMELASAFVDPFGRDEVDFPVGHWLMTWLASVSALLEYKSPGDDDEWEAALKMETPLRRELIQLDLFKESGFVDTAKSPRRSPREGEWELFSLQKAPNGQSPRLLCFKGVRGSSSDCTSSDEESLPG